MVGTPGTADTAAVLELETRLQAHADRFVTADHARGAVTVNFRALARLVAQILTEHTATIRQERAALWDLVKDRVRAVNRMCAQNGELHIEWFDLMTDLTRLRISLCEVLGYAPYDTHWTNYPGDAKALADLRELAAENRLRENEVISLGYEVEKLERALLEAARDSQTAARFVDTMIAGGAR